MLFSFFYQKTGFIQPMLRCCVYRSINSYLCVMRYYWDMLQHFFVANSRHGTHSPFVYDLAVHAIYTRSSATGLCVPEGFNPIYKSLLARILLRMGKSRLSYFGDDGASDVLWLVLQEARYSCVLDAVRQGKVVVVHEPLRTTVSKRVWQELTEHTDVVVSINLFHFGLLLYKSGQRKENFLLRYPFWQFKKLR